MTAKIGQCLWFIASNNGVSFFFLVSFTDSYFLQSIIALAFLSAGLPSIMNVSKRLAVNRDGSIRDGNLYFFAWISLFCALVVFLGYLSDSPHAVSGFGSLFSWPFLCLTSFVVMASAIDLMNEHEWCNFQEDQRDTSEFCTRTRFAVALGAIGGLFALVWTFVAHRAPVVVDRIFCILVCVLWVAAVSVITFGGSHKAPGTQVGNLFFFTWASCGIATMMALDACSGMWLANNNNNNNHQRASGSSRNDSNKEKAAKLPGGDVESS